MLFRSPTLTIELRSKTNNVFLCPNLGKTGDGMACADDPTSDSIVEGLIKLVLPVPAKVEGLSVEFIGTQNVFLGSRVASYNTIRTSLDLCDKESDQTMAPGEHTFSFSFVIPAWMAPSDESLYGRTYYKLKAQAGGLGRFGKALKAEHLVYLVVNPSPIGSVVPAFDMHREGESHALGTVFVSMMSNQLSVAGYVGLSINFPAIVKQVTLESIAVELHQEFELHHLLEADSSRYTRKVIFVPWKTPTDSKGPLAELKPGQAYSLVERFQLAKEKHSTIRPSAAGHSETGIEIRHMFVVVLNIECEGRRERVTVSHPVVLAACCCLLEDLQLPAYSEQPVEEDTSIARDQVDWCSRCLCTLSAMPLFVEQEYGVCEDDLRKASSLSTSTAWKNDEDYCADLQRLHSQERPDPAAIPIVSSVRPSD